MTPEPGAGRWADAIRVAALLAADPQACVGIRLRAGAGPVRDAWLRHLTDRLATGTPVRRCPPGIGDDRLLGGLDLAATLSAGRPVAQAGLLAEADGGLLVVPMAERLSPGTAARLAAALDTGTVAVARDGFFETRAARFGLVLLDEGLDDEAPPVALTERLAFDVDLRDLALRDIEGATASDPARRTPDRAMEPDDASEAVAALCAAAEALGVASLRGPLLAVRIARLIAACDGRSVLAEPDLAEAARFVLGPRATRMPAPEQPGDDAEPPPPQASPEDDRPPDASADEAASELQQAEPPSLDDVVLAAALAAIPPGLLAALAAGQAPARGGKAGKAGAAAAAMRQGRPIGARAGDPRCGRLALLATLRAAAPWQALRRSETGAGEARAIIVRPEDIRITRYRQRTESTTIFAVDASGSAALERLAEAKGAVELLLAEAYVRRDRVALVAFRGRAAELVLPPTRSLVRAKRGLAELPGGGGTPLAAGLDAAADMALAVRRGGGTPVVVLLTDGRANVDRTGTPGRPRASEDARAAALRFRAAGYAAILIDTAPRPQDSARALAEAMGARYLPLPQADARKLSAAVRAAGEAA
ncbi:magnesium chelatase subunit D [Methylobacterium sp. WL12]|uniref:magnesium chelatase subunit D n=1 Tax=Methylobacterium sp. WL12 TaxID=2603890 RepID=UPI0011C74D66|nr:magnesium chelatase subunit D [Methylobacterium sp. WL12]TXM71070.1 magnesium chelatase subunit D [Methylobacterium sp. WL12]